MQNANFFVHNNRIFVKPLRKLSRIPNWEITRKKHVILIALWSTVNVEYTTVKWAASQDLHLLVTLHKEKHYQNFYVHCMEVGLQPT